MTTWPAIALISFGLFAGFLAFARLREGSSAEFSTAPVGQKIQTLALIYAGCFVLVAVAWGLVLLLIDYY